MVHKYKKGYIFELKTKKDWEQRGYAVVRSSGSHSPVDLIAMKDKSCIQIQCKNMERKISRVEKQEITEWANATGFPVLIMYKSDKVINEYISPAHKGVRV